MRRELRGRAGGKKNRCDEVDEVDKVQLIYQSLRDLTDEYLKMR
jgi:hypothetical protein